MPKLNIETMESSMTTDYDKCANIQFVIMLAIKVYISSKNPLDNKTWISTSKICSLLRLLTLSTEYVNGGLVYNLLLCNLNIKLLHT